VFGGVRGGGRGVGGLDGRGYVLKRVRRGKSKRRNSTKTAFFKTLFLVGPQGHKNHISTLISKKGNL